MVINEVHFQLAAAIEVGFHRNVLGAQFAKGKPFVVDAVAQSHHGLGRKPGVLVFKGSVGRTCDFNVRVRNSQAHAPVGLAAPKRLHTRITPVEVRHERVHAV